MGGGKERKMNSGSPTAGQVKDGGKGLKQKLLQTEDAEKYFIKKALCPT
jgi:hypothetical protein